MKNLVLLALIFSFVASIFLVYDGHQNAVARDAALVSRATLIAKIEVALGEQNFREVVTLSDNFLMSSDPWKTEDAPTRSDPRNTQVAAARQIAIEALVLQGSIDNDIEAISQALDL